MVLLLTKGLAQKPIERIKANGIIKKNIPDFKSIISPNPPTINGITAPPAMPVHKIPELSANEKMMEYITEIKKPINGKPIKANSVEPVRVNTKQSIVIAVATINILRLSMNFKSNNPNKQPMVNIAQK